ncbi:hypothetical protein FZ934_24450 (plasmid) [Rhizobium grahamii]|uniref:Lipopolysaccharide biosynthesis protein n=1 Tax=Rhizobium grahamii TaxID=1120045 RepID=A0A5Q0CGY2_9HYPH|nr:MULTISPECIES: hypothetical protein [Rhizobium]QFY63417.1 hypothetical protein FZ934_24450 [Rhizobium grahamii]QRM51818.1 hypothetical protein F3Y33_21195 [Rhizobium sp. BG6]
MNYIDPSTNLDAHRSGKIARLQTWKFPLQYIVGAALAFALILALMVAALQVTPPKFQASANLLVLLSDDYVARPAAGSAVAPTRPTMDRDAYMMAEGDILGSDTVIDQAISSIGPDILYPASTGLSAKIKSAVRYVGDLISGVKQNDRSNIQATIARARRAVLKSLRIDSGRSGSVINVTYENTDRNLAATFVSTLIDAYFARRATLFADPQTAVLTQQVKTKSDELQIAKAGLADFRQRYAISDFNLQRELLLKRLADLSHDLRATEVGASETQARRKTVLDQLAALPTDPARRATGAEAGIPLGGLVEALQKEINELEQELSANAARQVGLKARIAAMASDLRTLNEQEGTLHDLTLRRDVLERQYAQGLETLSERKATEAIEQARLSNVRLIDAPEPPQRPTSQRMLIVATGLLLAFFSMGAILALGWLRRPGSQRLRWFA